MIKNKLVSALIVLSLIGSSSTAALATEIDTSMIRQSKFEDMKGHWAYNIVLDWESEGIINGISETEFGPNNKILRKDFAVILAKLTGLSETTSNTFKDLPDGEYYTDSMLALSKEGILTGSDGKIRPEDAITREEAAVVMAKAFHIKPKVYQLSFTDKDSISKWSELYVGPLETLGVINGDSNNRINAKSNLTRAEAMTLIDNLIQVYSSEPLEFGKYDHGVMINSPNTSIHKTDILGTVYTAKSKKLDISESIITGMVVTNSNVVNIESSSVDVVQTELDCSAININGTVKSIVSYSRNLSINGTLTESLTVTPNSKVVYNGKLIENNQKWDIVYTQQALNALSFESNDIAYTGSILSDNTVKTQIKIGNTKVEEYGVIYNTSSKVPTYTLNDKIVKGNGDKTGIIDIGETFKVKPGDTICIRVYTINNNGTDIKYSKPVVIKAYDYKIGMKIANTEAEKTNGTLTGIIKTVQFSLTGSNIPELIDIELLSSKHNTLDDESAITSTQSKIKYDTSNELQTNKVYEARVRFDVGYGGAISIDKYYGYRITTNAGKSSVFPIVVDESVPNNSVNTIQTGTASFDTGYMIVSDNGYNIGNTKLKEAGIVLTVRDYGEIEPDRITVGNTWKEYKANDISSISVDLKSIGGNVPNKIIYYAFYVKTDVGASYGRIKQIMTESVPVYTGNYIVDTNAGGTIAVLKMKIDSSSELDLSGSVINQLTDEQSHSKVDGYTNKKLSETNAKYTNGMLKITFEGLKPNVDYYVTMKVKNSTGISDNIHIQFKTSV